jgi:hypothetical protein
LPGFRFFFTVKYRIRCVVLLICVFLFPKFVKYIFFRFNSNQENFVFKLKSNKHPMSVLHEYCQKGQYQYLPTFPIQSLFVSLLGCWVQFYSEQLEFCDKVKKLNSTFFCCTNELKTRRWTLIARIEK